MDGRLKYYKLMNCKLKYCHVENILIFRKHTMKYLGQGDRPLDPHVEQSLDAPGRESDLG